MKFDEAKKRLDEMAAGKYRELRYALTTPSNMPETATCAVYVDGPGWFEAPTWTDVLAKLADAMFPHEKASPPTDEAPTHDDAPETDSVQAASEVPNV